MSVAPSRATRKTAVSIAGTTLTAATIKCCLCGMDITGLHSMCLNCLAKETDLAAGLPKQETLTQCRECGKWRNATGRWMRCEPESADLLALCLKKIKSLGTPKGPKLVDAKFVWTEEHSKRLLVRMVLESTDTTSRRDVIRQSFECQFVIHTQMCSECQSDTVDQTWRSVVQLRQAGVTHRRTLFFLEQEIIQRKLAEKASNVQESPNGLDVYFNKHEWAVKFADACQAIVPVASRSDTKKLTGQDLRNNEYRFRHTLCLEIVPLCKYDLCVLPKALRSSFLGGSRNGLVLVESVAYNVHLLDVETGKRAELPGAKFAANPFKAIASAKDLIEYMVLDTERNGEGSIDIEAGRVKDLGENDSNLFVKTWARFASARVESGDIIMGYDVSQLPVDEFADVDALPPAVFVQKQVIKEGKSRSRKHKGKKGPASEADLQSIAVDEDVYFEDDVIVDKMEDMEINAT